MRKLILVFFLFFFAFVAGCSSEENLVPVSEADLSLDKDLEDLDSLNEELNSTALDSLEEDLDLEQI